MLDISNMPENAGNTPEEIANEGATPEETTVTHGVTAEEIEANGLQGELNPGDEIKIPVQETTESKEEISTAPVPKNFVRCLSCGKLLSSSPEYTYCPRCQAPRPQIN